MNRFEQYRTRRDASMFECSDAGFADITAEQSRHRFHDDGVLPGEEGNVVSSESHRPVIGRGDAFLRQARELPGRQILCGPHQ